ncbi:hypothetical protein BDW60DRAFT_201089 [Aspergillus nidulans var. acristatus]
MQRKVPIQRLRHERYQGGKRRTVQACDTCRQRKTKCDGNRPACGLCRSQGVRHVTIPK